MYIFHSSSVDKDKQSQIYTSQVEDESLRLILLIANQEGIHLRACSLDPTEVSSRMKLQLLHISTEDSVTKHTHTNVTKCQYK